MLIYYFYFQYLRVKRFGRRSLCSIPGPKQYQVRNINIKLVRNSFKQDFDTTVNNLDKNLWTFHDIKTANNFIFLSRVDNVYGGHGNNSKFWNITEDWLVKSLDGSNPFDEIIGWFEPFWWNDLNFETLLSHTFTFLKWIMK